MKGKFDKGKLEKSAPAEKYLPGKDPNYNKNKQIEPEKRMGAGSFADLPTDVILRKFSKSHNYRSGVVNDFTCGLEEESGISENKV